MNINKSSFINGQQPTQICKRLQENKSISLNVDYDQATAFEMAHKQSQSCAKVSSVNAMVELFTKPAPFEHDPVVAAA